MLKKIIFTIIIVIVIYNLVIFLKPELAKSIGNTLGLTSFNEEVIYLKNRLDGKSTGNTNSGSTVDNAINTVVKGIDSTKEKIDDIRVTANGVEKKYEETKKVLNDVKTLGNGISSFVKTGSIR